MHLLSLILFQISLCDRCQRTDKLKSKSKELHPIVTEAPWQVYVKIVVISLFPKIYVFNSGER